MYCPEGITKAWENHEFLGFARILLSGLVQGLVRLVGSRGRGRLGIGPQGRHNVLRHSREARGTVGIDPDGPESPQVVLN